MVDSMRRVLSMAGALATFAASRAARAQTEYYNLDASRPLRVEDAVPTERYGLDLDLAPARLERYDAEDAAEVMRRIEVRLVDVPLQGYAALHITTTDGRRIDAVRERYRADEGERRAWLRRHVERNGFSSERFARIEDAVSRLEAMPDVRELTALLRG